MQFNLLDVASLLKDKSGDETRGIHAIRGNQNTVYHPTAPKWRDTVEKFKLTASGNNKFSSPLTVQTNFSTTRQTFE